jgi:hypothetical protein
MDNKILYTAKFTHHDLKFHKVWWKSDKRCGSWSAQTDKQTDRQADSYIPPIYDLQKETCKVEKHSIPCFIPVLELEKKLLKVDPKQFFLKLSDYLFAYVSRREELRFLEIGQKMWKLVRTDGQTDRQTG